MSAPRHLILYWLNALPAPPPILPSPHGGWWRWALVSPDGVAPSWMVTWSVCLPLLIFPCTIKSHSRSSLLALAHLGDAGQRAVKQLWWWWWWMLFLMPNQQCQNTDGNVYWVQDETKLVYTSNRNLHMWYLLEPFPWPVWVSFRTLPSFEIGEYLWSSYGLYGQTWISPHCCHLTCALIQSFWAHHCTLPGSSLVASPEWMEFCLCEP